MRYLNTEYKVIKQDLHQCCSIALPESFESVQMEGCFVVLLKNAKFQYNKPCNR